MLERQCINGKRMVQMLGWMQQLHRARREHFQQALVARDCKLDDDFALEVYEISEYARQVDPDGLRRLFPGML